MIKAKNSIPNYVPYFIGTAIAASFGVATSVHAQTKALEEVIVTAQKREQSVQEVPISITALTQESLETNRVSNVTDLSGLAPNVAVRPSPGGIGIAAFSIRGVTSYGTVPGSDKEVSIYLDGVYIGTPTGSVFNLPDIAQLEILRGPQGTLFGRNATAGAINITTRDPAGELGLRQELSYGNHAYYRQRTSVDSPAWGPFSFAVTYAKEKRQGDIKNLAAGTEWDRTAFGFGTEVAPAHLGDKDTENYFLAAKFQPTDIFSMVYKLDHTTDHGTPGATVPVAYNHAALDPIINNQATPFQLTSNARRPNSVTDAWTVPLNQSNTGHSLTTVADLSDSVSLKNITAYRKTQVYAAVDLTGFSGLFIPGTGIPFCVYCTQNDDDSDQWSTEFQVNYDSDLLTATFGALYFESSDRAGGPINSVNAVPFGTFPNHVIPAGNESVSFNEAQSTAAYTQVEYHLASEVDLVGGLRWTRDRKSGEFRFGTDPNKVVEGFRYEDSRPSYTFGVNYKPAYDTLVFVKYSNAFVSGGSVAGEDFEAETAKSWEAGVKSDFLDSKLRSNLSIYSVTYEHLQTAQGGPSINRPELGTVVVDLGGETKAYGFEWEGSASVGYGVTLNGSLGYTHVGYSDVDPILVASVGGGPGGLPGSKYLPSLNPDWTGNLSAQYESDPLFGQSYLALNLSGSWHSKIRLEQNPARAEAFPEFAVAEYSPASWVVNARATLKKIDLGFAGAQGEVGIWGRNLTDNDYPTYALDLGGFALGSNYLEARSYGVDFIVQF